MRMIVSQIKGMRAALDALNQCGPLTLLQMQRLAHNPNPTRIARYLVKNGYAGLLPTFPVKLISTGKPFDVPEMTKTMIAVMGTLKRIGPGVSSFDIATAMGTTRETVDSYLREGKERGICHVSGDKPSPADRRMRVYVWTAGPGENFVREKVTSKARVQPVSNSGRTTDARRDALTEALFGVTA